MKVIITEKASMKAKYFKALKGHKDVVVVNSIGHIEELIPLEELLDLESKYWNNIEPKLPFIPSNFNHVIKKHDIYKGIKKSVRTADEIILACDPDREGELIHRNILEILKKEKAVKASKITRIWLHSETPKGIQEGFENRKDYKEFEGFYITAKAREVVDWLLGIQFTILFSIKFGVPGKPVSVGRIQSWLLSEICKRTEENKNFKKQKYFVFSFIEEDSQVSFNLIDEEEKLKRIFEQKEAQNLFDKINNKPLTITNIETKNFTENPPSLYNIAGLQKDVSKKIGLSPKETLQIAQALYEKHEILSYPRTDCKVLSLQEASQIKNAVQVISLFPEYNDLISHIEKINSDYKIHKKNIGEIKGHYALIPVLNYEKKDAPNLNKEEKFVFDLIVQKLLMNLLPVAKGQKTKIIGEIEGEKFKTEFKNYTQLGFLEFFNKKDEKIISIDTQEGKKLKGNINQEKKETQPPPLFDNAKIISLMESAHLLVEDKNLQKALKNAEGIGTGATRDSFIPLLLKRGYIEKKGKKFIPTEKGNKLFDLLPKQLKTPDFSAKLEYDFAQIIEGKSQKSFQNFVQEAQNVLEPAFSQIREQYPNSQQKNNNEKKEVGKCPLCKSPVLASAKCYFCSNRDCNFVIWLSYAGTKLKLNEVKELIEKGQTSKKISMKSKKGKKFEAKLSYDQKNNKIEFLF